MSRSIKGIYVLESIAFGLGLVSAIGSTCPTLWPPTTGPLSIMFTLQPIFMITTSLTYVAAILSGILIWALWARKRWFYNAALIVSLIGSLTGFIPAFLVMNNGLKFSPSLMRAFLYLVIFILLLMPFVNNSIRLYITNTVTATSGNLANIAVLMYVLLGFGFILIIQPFIMPATHIIDGVNYYDFAEIQFFGGLASMVIGLAARAIVEIRARMTIGPLYIFKRQESQITK